MIILLFVACLLFVGTGYRKDNRYYYCCMIVLFFITALRYPVLGGTDNLQYAITYNKIPKLSEIFDYNESEFTIGYLLFNSLSKTVYDSYIFFQIIYTGCTIYLLHRVICKLGFSNSEKCLFLFGYFCYKFLWYFWGTLRQNIADLVFWYLILFYYQRKDSLHTFQKMLLLAAIITIPTLFHSSGALNLVFFPGMLFLSKQKNVNRRLFVTVITSILLLLYSSNLFSVSLNLVTKFVDERYMLYQDYEAGGANLINYLFRLFFFVLFCKKYDKISYKHKDFVLDSLTMTVLIGSINQPLMGRVLEYYAIGLYMCMGLLVQYFSPKSVNVYRFIFFIAMIAIFIRFLVTSDDGLNTNYYLFWQEPTGIKMVENDKGLFGL